MNQHIFPTDMAQHKALNREVQNIAIIPVFTILNEYSIFIQLITVGTGSNFESMICGTVSTLHLFWFSVIYVLGRITKKTEGD